MTIPVALIGNLVGGLMGGPISKILDAYIHDVELRRKLEADLQAKLVDHLGREMALEQSIILAEINSDSWLTKTWRPLLMLSFLGFLGFVGLALPLADLIAGHTLPFNPRWGALPPEFWNFLSVGIGGYVGGRSLEKIAGVVQVPGRRGKA